MMIKAITSEIGLVKNIAKLPSDRIRDLRKFTSMIGPRTNAMTNEAREKFNTFIMYPITPINKANHTLKNDPCSAKTATTDNTKTMGTSIGFGTVNTLENIGVKNLPKIYIATVVSKKPNIIP